MRQISSKILNLSNFSIEQLSTWRFIKTSNRILQDDCTIIIGFRSRVFCKYTCKSKLRWTIAVLLRFISLLHSPSFRKELIFKCFIMKWPCVFCKSRSFIFYTGNVASKCWEKSNVLWSWKFSLRTTEQLYGYNIELLSKLLSMRSMFSVSSWAITFVGKLFHEHRTPCL